MSRRTRFAIVVVAMAALVLALPVSAHAAKYKTRLQGYTGFKTEHVVDRTVPGSQITTPVAKVRLQRYYRGAWRNLAGTIRVYRTTTQYGSNQPLTAYSKKYAAGSWVSVPLSIRGEYRFYFAGDAYNAKTERYSVRYDDIVSSFSTPTVNITPEGGSSAFSTSQTVDWNTTDYPGLRADLRTYVQYYDFSEISNEMTSTDFEWRRTITRPGTFTHAWYADNADFALTYRWLNSSLTFNDPFIWSEEFDHDTYFD